MGGHGSPAGVHGVDYLAHFISRPGRHPPLGPVQVQLDEVGPVVELSQRGGQQPVRILHLDGQAARKRRAFRQPGTRRADVRVLGVSLPAVSQVERERPLLAVARVGPPGRADVADPAHPGADQGRGIPLGGLQQRGRRVGAARYPLRAAWQGQVTVAVDHAGNDGGSACVDHLRAGPGGRGGLSVEDACQDAGLDPDAHRRTQRGTGSVCQCRAFEEHCLSHVRPSGPMGALVR
jgi:hypothetical protein